MTFAGNLLTTLTSAILGALIAYWLAFRRFREEKWWERKADAYIRIMEALHNSQVFSRTHIDFIQRGAEISDEDDKRLRELSKENTEEIIRVSNVGKLFLFSTAIDRLQRYLRESDTFEAESWHDYLEKEYDNMSCVINDLVLIARKDLQVGSKGKIWDFADPVRDRLRELIERPQSRVGGDPS